MLTIMPEVIQLCRILPFITNSLQDTTDTAKMKAALAFAMALSVATAAVPQFAQEWSSFIVSDLVQNQGTFNGPNDSLCCDINALDCQVQVQSQGGMTYFSLSRNATSQINGPGQDPYAIVTLFNDNREYAVDANWNCEEFCPNGGALCSCCEPAVLRLLLCPLPCVPC